MAKQRIPDELRRRRTITTVLRSNRWTTGGTKTHRPAVWLTLLPPLLVFTSASTAAAIERRTLQRAGIVVQS
jgi:hypothetical protein